MTPIELYEIKLRTGNYDGYDKCALELLYEDCVRQCGTMRNYGGDMGGLKPSPNTIK